MARTIGLNIIVGAGEGVELERCLQSFRAKEMYDEVVIGLTADDPVVRNVALTYATKVIEIEWATERYPFGNFAAARNAVLVATTADYVWWQDADDILMPAVRGRQEELLAKLRDDAVPYVDVVFVPYAVVSGADGEPVQMFMRDRVFRRTRRLRWKYPVHECVRDSWTPDDAYGIARNLYTTHAPYKHHYESALRNIRILEHEVSTARVVDPHIEYFLARDLLVAGRCEESERLVHRLLDERKVPPEMMYLLCIDHAFWHAYRGAEMRPRVDQMPTDEYDAVETWLRVAIAFSQGYAEPYVLLGDVYLNQGYRDKAMSLYKFALSRKLTEGLLQSIPYYEEVPAGRLADMHSSIGDYETALWYAKRAWRHDKGSKELMNRRVAIFNCIRDVLIMEKGDGGANVPS